MSKQLHRDNVKVEFSTKIGIRRNYTSSTHNKDFDGFMITTNYGGSLKVQGLTHAR